MSMSESADGKAVDMATPSITCTKGTQNPPDCTCTLQFGTGGLSVKGVAMKRVDMNSSRLALLLEGGTSTIVDVFSIKNDCNPSDAKIHKVTIPASGELSMTANKSCLLLARDNFLVSLSWDLGYIDIYQKYTGKHLSVASNVNGSMYGMIFEQKYQDGGSGVSILASDKIDFSSSNLASGISANQIEKIAIGVNDELLVWNSNGIGTRYEKKVSESSIKYETGVVVDAIKCDNKLCLAAIGDIDNNKTSDFFIVNSSGIVRHENGMQSGTNVSMEKNVQAIAVAIPSGEKFEPNSDPPRLVWATAGNGASTNPTQVTVKFQKVP